MSVFRYAILLGCCLLAAPLAFAQQANIAIGEWRSHFPFTHALSVTKAGTKVYCATEGGFYVYDTDDNSLKPLSKAEGFSDVGVKKVLHDPQTNITLVAYHNTNIDLIYPDGSIRNLSDIFRKQVIGAKVIRNVYFNNGLAYLSTSFGVVVIDLQKREVKDTYSNLGPDGRVLDVHATITLNDSIYIAARDNNTYRIRRARLTATNLLDFSNWHLFERPGIPTTGFAINTLAAFRGKLYAGLSHNGVYRYNGNAWDQVIGNSGDIHTMKAGQESLLITNSYNVTEILPSGQLQVTDNAEIEVSIDGHRDGNELWIAEYDRGLLRARDGQTESIQPNGPYSTNAFDLWSANNQVIVAAGAYDKSDAYRETNNPSGFYVYADGEWKNYNPIQITDRSQYPMVRDLVEVVQDPNSGTLYFGSYGYGLMKWNGLGNFEVFDDSNSPLINLIPGAPYTRVSGLAMDRNGTLWVVNRNLRNGGTGPTLFSYRPETGFTPYTIPNVNLAGTLEKIVVDDLGQKWIIVSYNVQGAAGVVVYDEKTNKSRVLLENAGQGHLPSQSVNSVTKDLNGAIWIGTTNGVGVFYSPNQILNPSYDIDSRIWIDGRYLLENQIVNDIAVDGANRKWIAAESGLWLFNETGTELIQHFTTENSPLPSNRVNKVIVNHTSGEVFIATDAGLVSYRGTATISEVDDACKGVFPNPVRPGFTGTVGISGVPANSMVKITDTNGVLVHEVKANGNTATWNLRDYNGTRVRSGIYLILSANADGTEKYMCKVAVLE